MKRSGGGNNYYAARERAIAQLWRDLGKPCPYNQFKQSEQVRQFTREFHSNYYLHGSERPGTSASEDSGPSSKRITKESDVVQGGDDFDIDRILSENSNQPVDWDAFFRDFGPDFLNSQAMEDSSQRMEIDQARAVGVDSTTGGAVGGKSGSVNSGGPSIVLLPKSHNSNSFSFSFHKTRTLFSYAYANTELSSDPINKNIDWFCTPLSFIPVDFLPFYLSPGEYESLPLNCKVTRVWCKVSVMGVRAAFDVGATITGTATSEYCPILQWGIGLNNVIDTYNSTYEAQGMVPSKLGGFKPNDYIEKFYKHYTSSVQCVPRSNSHYFVQYWNKQSKPDDVTDPYQPNTGGMFRLDKYVNQALLNSAIGETVIDYEYKPVYGYINSPKQFQTCYANNQFGANINFPFMSNIYWNNSGYNEFRCIVDHKNLPERDYGSFMWSKFTPSYSQTIEMPNCMSASNPWCKNVPRQPQVHIGMSAIPQLNPSTELQTFLNAALYYNVECGIDIESNSDSVWTYGSPRVQTRDAVFFDQSSKKYDQPSTVCGFPDWRGGTISASHLLAMSENILSNTTSVRVREYLQQKKLSTQLSNVNI